VRLGLSLNTPEDIDRLVAALERAKAIFAF
jgi:hypothetical protein